MFSNSFTLRLMELYHLHVNNLMLVMLAILDIFYAKWLNIFTISSQKKSTNIRNNTIKYTDCSISSNRGRWAGMVQWNNKGKKKQKKNLDMNLFYCSYPYGTASSSIFTGTFAWDKQWLSHTEREEIQRQKERRWWKGEERQIKEGWEGKHEIYIYIWDSIQ